MSISTQLPPIPLAMASASLRALAQAAGQTVEARVLSQAANGTTQVQVGRQVLNLTLPQSQPVGSVLTLSVQQADGQLRLSVEGVRPPAAQAAVSQPSMATTTPATSVQLSAAALSGLPAAPNPSLKPSAGGVAGAQAPTPPTSTVGTSPAPPASAGVGPARPAYGGVPASTAVSGTAPSPPSVSGHASIATNATTAASAAQAAPRPVSGVVSPIASSASPVQGTKVPTGTVAQTALPSAPGAASPPPSAPVSPGAPPGDTIPAPAFGPSAPLTAPSGIPYAVAAPSSATPAVVVGPAGSAATALPPVGQAVPSSVVGQHAPQPSYGGMAPGASVNTSPVATSVPPAAASSPQAALAQMVQQAIPRQDSVVGLTTTLTAAAGRFALPEPVAKAAQQVLALRVPLDGARLDGTMIKTAVQRSGIFQEALLASGQGAQAAGDTKTALLGLRQTLGNWLGQQAPVAQVAAVAPPMRGVQLRARAGDGGTPNLPDDLMEAGKVLLERTEAALSRMRLHQNASLPDTNSVRQDSQWSLDLPVVIAGQQHLLQMQIHRDDAGDNQAPEDRGWQIRFAINLAGAGEIGAQIAMKSKSTGVMLWADQPETAAALAAGIEELKGELASIGLVPGAVVVRTGPPVAPQKQPAGHAGQHLDARR